MAVKQGEIYWATVTRQQAVGSEQIHRRPWVIVSRDAVNRAGRNVVAVPLTSKIAKASQYRVLIPAREMIPDLGCGLQLHDSVALTDQIRVLDVDRLEMPRIGCLSGIARSALELGLAFLFDIR